ncbi:MAG: arginine--tRNA ligase [Chloroflexi bacterium]|nr:arginine--tRNA ligase [Chloroflexota bacterium]
MAELVRDAIRSAIAAALDVAQADGTLPAVPVGEVVVERAQKPEHGDYASSVALRLAGTLKRKPLEIAEAIAERVETGTLIGEASVAAPGFINVRLSQAWKRQQVDAIAAGGATWANLELGTGRATQVEFVSANPTGPLHVAHGRGAVLGDSMARVLEAAGYAVQREYYVNDAGSQARTFGATLFARYQQLFGREAPIPEDGYPGEYMIDLAEEIRSEVGERYLNNDGATPELTERGIALVIESIQADLELLGVHFDHWFNESSLFEGRPSLEGQSPYEAAMGRLREAGFVSEREGAVWFTSTKLGEDKDDVLVRSSGEPTYFGSDVAYHFDKFVERSFERVIDVWGADHHGHVARTIAASEAVGGPAGGLDILLYQLVHLRRGEERVRMGKRSGNLVLLRELVTEVGKDATRYFMLQRSSDAQMDFDLDVATSQDPKQNPASYVKYAHARAASILRKGEEAGLRADGDVQLLEQPEELALIGEMLRLPELIAYMAERLEPHHLTAYAMELAQSFTDFYGACRVIDAEAAELSRARLRLTLAAKTTVARTLDLIGIDAPETM